MKRIVICKCAALSESYGWALIRHLLGQHGMSLRAEPFRNGNDAGDMRRTLRVDVTRVAIRRFSSGGRMGNGLLRNE